MQLSSNPHSWSPTLQHQAHFIPLRRKCQDVPWQLCWSDISLFRLGKLTFSFQMLCAFPWWLWGQKEWQKAICPKEKTNGVL